MATVQGCDIRIVKGGKLYPLRLQRIVKGGTSYPIASSSNAFGIVKGGNLYVMLPRKYNFNPSSRMLRSVAPPPIPLDVTIIKTTRDGNALSRDISIGIGDTVYSLTGFQNTENHYLCDVDTGGTYQLQIVNSGIQSFVVSSIEVLCENKIIASLDNIEGIYQAGEGRIYDVSFTDCTPGLLLTIKINIHD